LKIENYTQEIKMTFTSIKTLKDIEKNIPQKSGGGGGAKKFFNLQSGDTYKIRFRQELTEDSKNFDEEVGTGIIVPVVTSPINWKWRCASTAQSAEHGYRCWASEQIGQDGRWKPKPHLLINIAVEIDGVWEPRILDTTFNQRHIGLILMEYAKEFGSIVNQNFKYSRTGSGAQDTNYSLIPLGESEADASIADLQMHQLDNVYMTLGYDKQKQFLTTGELNSDSW
jgi:hypothetical protein